MLSVSFFSWKKIYPRTNCTHPLSEFLFGAQQNFWPLWLPGEIYLFLWDYVKSPLNSLFDEFIDGNLDIGGINFGTIRARLAPIISFHLVEMK
jgi:hypothetical protein